MFRSDDQAVTVLLVEDEPSDADAIEAFLEDTCAAGDRLLRAKNLAEAVDTLGAAIPDVVLLDLRLPDGVGVPCVQAIRSHCDGAPIIVLTGLADDRLAIDCLEAGAQDYISKNELEAIRLRRAINYARTRSLEVNLRRRADLFQERLAAIVEASNDAIISTDLDGRITSWNGGAEKVTGYRADEAIGRLAELVLRPVDRAGEEARKERLKDLRAGIGIGEPEELLRLTKTGAIINLTVVTCALRDDGGALVGLAAICRDTTERRKREAELQERHEELLRRDRQMRALTERLNRVREEERTRISRAVHDVLGQLLTGIKMDLKWIGRRVVKSADDAIHPKLRETEELVDKTVAAVQAIALELRPSVLDSLGLAAGIRDEARRFQTRTSVQVSMNVHDEIRPDPESATQIFRVFQELLTNISRHAEARRVVIILAENEHDWTLEVTDDGRGLPVAAEERPGSLGILGIRERAASVRGSFELISKRGAGTTARLRVPRKDHEGE